MKKLFIKSFLIISVIITFSTIHIYAYGGNGIIKGKVSSKDKRYTKETVVYIENAQGNFPPPEDHAKMDLVKLTFIPHILIVLKGTTVDYLNKDGLPHSVFSPDDVTDKMDLGTWSGEEVRSYTFNKLGAAAMLCKQHPNMESYVVVLQNPYFSRTDKEGNYEIKDIPHGEYTLKVWSNRYLAKHKMIEVKKGDTITVDFKLKK